MCIVILSLCVVLLCVRAVLTILMFYLNAGLLASSQYPEGPATGHLGTGFTWFPCLIANAEMVPKIPSCHYMLLM
jgi:hypothetical protein